MEIKLKGQERRGWGFRLKMDGDYREKKGKQKMPVEGVTRVG